MGRHLHLGDNSLLSIAKCFVYKIGYGLIFVAIRLGKDSYNIDSNIRSSHGLSLRACCLEGETDIIIRF